MKKLLLVISLIVASSIVVGSALAASPNSANINHQGFNWRGQNKGEAPAAVGIVSAISNDTITINSSRMGRPVRAATTSITYAVDISNATIIKDGKSATSSDIAIGDMAMVQGSISGFNIKATLVRINTLKPHNPPIQIKGNGEPVIGGSVTAINGSTLTITNKSNVTYTVDAAEAKIIENNATSSISDINTGDNVIVQGAVNGNSVVAYSVIVAGPAKQSPTNNTSTQPINNPGFIGRIFGGLGNFFHKLFGFF